MYFTNLSATNTRDSPEFVEFYAAQEYFGIDDLSPSRFEMWSFELCVSILHAWIVFVCMCVEMSHFWVCSWSRVYESILTNKTAAQRSVYVQCFILSRIFETEAPSTPFLPDASARSDTWTLTGPVCLQICTLVTMDVSSTTTAGELHAFAIFLIFFALVSRVGRVWRGVA